MFTSLKYHIDANCEFRRIGQSSPRFASCLQTHTSVVHAPFINISRQHMTRKTRPDNLGGGG